MADMTLHLDPTGTNAPKHQFSDTVVPGSYTGSVHLCLPAVTDVSATASGEVLHCARDPRELYAASTWTLGTGLPHVERSA
ncbi:hypothetical protein [Marivita hallyeonensis]|uniref:hypothetical protein n=1 Tax=Marivita hallyeonensis TaxID=996342 RepID=UPI0009354D74|nr:hypothetical protein [Marivita hallyeonensis]